MPRDASGTYTLPEAPFQPATVAQSARINHNFSDIAAALSDSHSISLSQPLQDDLQMNGHQILGIGGDLAPTGNVTASGNVTAAGQYLSVGSNATYYPTLTIDGAATSNRQIIGETAGKNRWIVALGDSSAETGSNNGSNFAVLRYADDGTTQTGTPLSISRANGQMTLAQTLNANGGVATSGITAATVTTSGAITTAGNVSAATVGVTGNLTAASAGVTGNVSVGGTLNTSGNLTVPSATINGALTATGAIQGTSVHARFATGRGGFVGSYQGDIASNLGMWGNADILYFGHADGTDTPVSALAYLYPSGKLYVTGSVECAAEVHAGNRGVYYDGINGAHATAFIWTGTQLDLYVDKNRVGQVMTGSLQREDGAPAIDELVARLEARIAALEAARSG